MIVDKLLKPSEVLLLSMFLYGIALLSGLALWYLLNFDKVILYLIGIGFILGFSTLLCP